MHCWILKAGIGVFLSDFSLREDEFPRPSRVGCHRNEGLFGGRSVASRQGISRPAVSELVERRRRRRRPVMHRRRQSMLLELRPRPRPLVLVLLRLSDDITEEQTSIVFWLSSFFCRLPSFPPCRRRCCLPSVRDSVPLAGAYVASHCIDYIAKRISLGRSALTAAESES